MDRRSLLRAALGAPFASGGSRAHSADDFVQSAGVCTHLSSPPYATQLPLIRQRLAELGVRTLRDELRPDDDRHLWRALFQEQGIRAHWLVSPATNTVPQMLDAIAETGPGAVAAIEGQNEGDSPWFQTQPVSRPRWNDRVVAYQREIFTALRARHPQIPVVSPSLLDYRPQDVPLIRGAARFCDIAAIHPYAQHGQEPETADDYASLAWYLRRFSDPFKPGAPVMATEAGYASSGASPVPRLLPEAVVATYLPRLLLHFFAAGVQRTFIYELMDEGFAPDSEQHYGLLRPGGEPKPAFVALSRLLGALADPGPPFQPGVLPVLVEGDVRHVCFQQRDGTILVALWRAARCWDPAALRNVTVAPVTATLTHQQVPAATSVLRLDRAGWSSAPGGRTLQISVDHTVLLVRLVYPTSGTNQ